MKYRRLKTLDSTGVPILRYYKLKEGEYAYTNAFYGLEKGIASKIEGAVGEDVTMIGFSHGGNALAKNLLFLDIRSSVLYMAILEDGDDRPDIGDVVNGYQLVVDTHYEDESAEGKNEEYWGAEMLDVPYYVFRIVQPQGAEYATEVDDSDAGDLTPAQYPVEGGDTPVPPTPPTPEVNRATISVITEGGTGILKYQETSETEVVEVTLTQAGGETYVTKEVGAAGDTLGSVYVSIAMYDDTGENLVVDLASVAVSGETYIPVAVPVVTP